MPPLSTGAGSVREKDILAAVLSHWRSLGLPLSLVASLPNMGAMGQLGLTKGIPDLLVMAPGLPVGFIELKTDTGKPSTAQLAFRERAVALGVPCVITYGRDAPIRVLEDWNVVRRVA